MDRMALHWCPFFSADLVSDFHLTEDFVLPSLYSQLSHPKGGYMNFLDVVQVFYVCLSTAISC